MDKKILDQIITGIFSFLGKSAATPVKPIQVQPAEPHPGLINQSYPPSVNQDLVFDTDSTRVLGSEPKVDWSDPSSKITDRFTVQDALLLPSWGVLHQPTEDEKAAIVAIAAGVGRAAEKIEQEIGSKVIINVHAWMRPEKANCPGNQWNGKDYNRYIYETQVWKDLTSAQKAEKKVPQSPHRTGHAIDFHVTGYEGKKGCAKIRAILVPHLEELGLRMEDIIGSWVHLDNMPVGLKRFFKP